VLAVSNVSVAPDQQARQGLLPNAAGVYTPVTGLNRSMLQYMSFWPDPNGPELLANGKPSARISARCEPTTRWGRVTVFPELTLWTTAIT